MTRRELLGLVGLAACRGIGAEQPLRTDTSTRRRLGQPSKLILALADVSTDEYQHESTSHALSVIENMGLRSGLYDTLIRTDTQLVTKGQVTTPSGTLVFYKNLSDFDGVLLMTSGEPRLTVQQKADLMSSIHDDGKGLIVVHSAISSFASWPEYVRMIGGSTQESPGESEDYTVKIETPGFPAMTGFGPVLHIRDRFIPVQPAREDGMGVLAKTVTGIPVVWINTFGKGRVFASQIGHEDAVWDRGDVQTMYREAIRWTLRTDLRAARK